MILHDYRTPGLKVATFLECHIHSEMATKELAA